MKYKNRKGNMYERQSEREKRVMKEQEWKRAVHGGSLVLTTSCACFLIMMVSNTRYPLYQVDMPSVDRYIQQLHKQNETIDKDAASDDGTSDRHDRDPNLTISTQTQPSSNAFVKFPKSLTCSFAGQSHEIPMVPNFLIVGVQKSGTTSLFKYLMQHPNVIPTKKFLEIQDNVTETIKGTETHFFDWFIPSTALEWARFRRREGLKDHDESLCFLRKQYTDYYPSDLITQPGDLAVDKTPSYFFKHPQIPSWIREVTPWINKIVLILRNPIDRAYSHHAMEYFSLRETETAFRDRINIELRNMREIGLSQAPKITIQILDNPDEPFTIPPMNLTGDEALEKYFIRHPDVGGHLKRGMYSIPLKLWLKHFSRDELLVINYDDFEIKGPKHVYHRVLEFVGLPPHDITSGYEKMLERSKYSTPMNPMIRRYLEKFYEPYNAELATLLGDEWKGVWASRQG
jgi:Sulfotransferase family